MAVRFAEDRIVRTLIRHFAYLTLSVAVLPGSRVFAQVESSLRWMTYVEKTRDGDAPGEFMILGEHRELLLRVPVANFAGAAVVGMEALERNVRISIQHDNEPVPIDVDLKLAATTNRSVLSPDAVVELTARVRRVDGAPFATGELQLNVDLSPALEVFSFDDGTRWHGRAKREETRRIVIRPVVSRADRIAFHDVEGHYLLGNGSFVEALSHFEQLVRLTPGVWRHNAALGAVYVRLGRYAEAIPFLERALPDFVRYGDPRGGVASELARAYLARGNESQAERALAATGLTREQVQERLNQIKASRRP